jgi:hypothetical protein
VKAHAEPLRARHGTAATGQEEEGGQEERPRTRAKVKAANTCNDNGGRDIQFCGPSPDCPA